MENTRNVLEDIKDKINAFDDEGLKDLCLKAVKMGISSMDIISALSRGMEIIGEKYEKGEYFITELIIGAETMKAGLSVLKPYMTDEMADISKGKMIIGTVLGDLHDIGKNIISTLLTASGFKIIDLGVDVPVEKFMEAVRSSDAQVLGMSALLTTTLEYMEVVVDQLKSAGLRDKVKIIIGGAVVTEKFAKRIGADAFAKDATTGVRICKEWVKAL